MSEEMFNDAINADDMYSGFVLCLDGTSNRCNNTTIHTQGVDFDYELIMNCRYYLEGIALTPISVFGMLGNALSIVVLSSKEMTSNFNQLLAVLASFDFIYLFVSVMVFGFPKLSSSYAENILPRAMPIAYGFLHIGRVGSVLLTLSVTVERFFAIVYPLKRIRRTRFLIYSSVIGAIAYNLPRFFEFKTNYMQIGKENKTLNIPSYEPTVLRTNAIYVQLYVVWMRFILIEMIPYVTICLLNTRIIVKAWKSKKSHRQLKEAQKESYEERKRELNMAVVLLWVVILFITCQSIKIIPDIYEALYCPTQEMDGQYYCETSTVVEVFVSVSNLAMAINSASNFVIYMLRGDKFRRVFKETIQKCCCIAIKSSPNSYGRKRSMSGTETYRLTTINTLTNTQSQITSPQMPHRVQNGPSSTSRRAYTQNTSVVSTKQKSRFKESNNESTKISVPKLSYTYSQSRKEYQQRNIVEIQLSDENEEADPYMP